MLQLASSTVRFLQAQMDVGNSSNYAAAYQRILDDLHSQYPNPSVLSPQDHDSLAWLETALQVNSGAVTPTAVYIRAVNQAAVYQQTGKIINLFGPEEQLSSNEVAKGAFRDILSQGGIASSRADKRSAIRH